MTLGRRIEIGCLIALCVFLPLYEAPKNIAWLAYVVAWVVNRALARDFGGRWDFWDTLLCAWLVSGLVIAPFAGVHGSEWHAALDIVRYATVGWMAKRSRLTDAEVLAVLASLVIAMWIGLAMGYAQLWNGVSKTLELNSVGHVNHSAIYLAIMLGLCAGWLFSGRQRVLAAATCALVLVSLFVGESRAGVAVGLLTLGALGLAWWPRSRVPALIAGVVLVVSVAALFAGAEVWQRHEQTVATGQTFTYRERAWSHALATWQRYPWFGAGMDNFSLTLRDESRKFQDLLRHPHSLYLGALAERGIVGAAPLAAVMVAWPFFLVRRRPAAAANGGEWLLWSGAAAAWTVSAVAGLVNTTLHHEHGLLAVLLLGLWLGRAHRG